MKAVRLEPAAVPPGATEQMMVKLEEPGTITGVQLDEPEAFEVVRIIAGRARADAPFAEVALPISPPNAFVLVLVRAKTEDTRICGGSLLLAGEGEIASAPQHATPSIVQPSAVVQATVQAVQSSGKKEFAVDARGWPQGGMNEVWVLMHRGEAERLVQAIHGYPITAAEKPAILRRFGQALGTVK